MGELYPRHEKQTKNPAETTGNRYKIEILMSRTQKLKELAAASLILKTLNDNPYLPIISPHLSFVKKAQAVHVVLFAKVLPKNAEAARVFLPEDVLK